MAWANSFVYTKVGSLQCKQKAIIDGVEAVEALRLKRELFSLTSLAVFRDVV